MKRIEATGNREWTKLERQDHATVCRALLDFPPFFKQMPSTTRYETPNRNPVKHLCCPKGHEIIRLQAEIDTPMLMTGKEDHQVMSLKQVGDESDNYVPASQVLIHDAADQPWGKDAATSKVVWSCAWTAEVRNSSNNYGSCDEVVPWGTTFCEKHKDEPEPENLNRVWDERVLIRCPLCTYQGVKRRSTLLVMYAVNVVTRQGRKLVLES